MLEFGKKNHVVLPYNVVNNEDSILIEASGVYNEAFLVFHGEIICDGIDLEKIYVRLNENIIKEINLTIEYRGVNKFDFDFSGLLSNEEVDKIKVINKKVLGEGEI